MDKRDMIKALGDYCDCDKIKCSQCVFDYPGTLSCQLAQMSIENDSEVKELYENLPHEWKIDHWIAVRNCKLKSVSSY